MPSNEWPRFRRDWLTRKKTLIPAPRNTVVQSHHVAAVYVAGRLDLAEFDGDRAVAAGSFPLSAGQDATGPAGDGEPVNTGDMGGKRHAQVIDQKPRNVLQRLGERGAVGGA